TVWLFAPRGEHQDRGVGERAVSSDPLEHLEPGQFGQHQVQHDERGLFLARGFERLCAGGRRGHAVAGACQMVCHQGDDIRLIVNNQDPIARLRYSGLLGHANLATKLYHARENVRCAPMATAGICYNRVTLTLPGWADSTIPQRTPHSLESETTQFGS